MFSLQSSALDFQLSENLARGRLAKGQRLMAKNRMRLFAHADQLHFFAFVQVVIKI